MWLVSTMLIFAIIPSINKTPKTASMAALIAYEDWFVAPVIKWTFRFWSAMRPARPLQSEPISMPAPFSDIAVNLIDGFSV